MYIFKRSSGFTLMELMIVVAIIGIIATIAVPAYSQYVIQAKRSDAKAALLQMQIAEEKYRANNTTYGTLADIGMSSLSIDGYYTITVATNTATDYLVTADPLAPFEDTACGTFAVNKDGAFYTGYASATCWGK